MPSYHSSLDSGVGLQGPCPVWHWSDVEPGHYFELVIDYDPSIYLESSVTIPFFRSEPEGLSTCMLEGLEFKVKSVAADSCYHITKSLSARVAPPLRTVEESPGSDKKLSDAPLTTF